VVKKPLGKMVAKNTPTAGGSGGILVIIFPGGGSSGHPVKRLKHMNCPKLFVSEW